MIEKINIDQCIRKERKALRQCYEACAPYVYTIIKNYIHNADEREDAMQEVFAEIFSSLQNYDSNKGSFKSWMSSVTIYQCIGILRKKKRLAVFLPAEGIEHQIGVEENLDTLSEEELTELLASMPNGYRTIFLLSVIDEYSHKEIASMLNISSETSRSQLSRALSWIRKNIKEDVKKYIYGTV